jgi:hypothetical protein
MQTGRKASPFRLLSHEYRKLRRQTRELFSPWDALKALSEQKRQLSKQLSSLLGLSILISLALSYSSSVDDFEIKTTWITLNVPNLYLAFAAGLILSFSMLEALSYFIAK